MAINTDLSTASPTPSQPDINARADVARNNSRRDIRQAVRPIAPNQTDTFDGARIDGQGMPKKQDERIPSQEQPRSLLRKFLSPLYNMISLLIRACGVRGAEKVDAEIKRWDKELIELTDRFAGKISSEQDWFRYNVGLINCERALADVGKYLCSRRAAWAILSTKRRVSLKADLTRVQESFGRYRKLSFSLLVKLWYEAFRVEVDTLGLDSMSTEEKRRRLLALRQRVDSAQFVANEEQKQMLRDSLEELADRVGA